MNTADNEGSHSCFGCMRGNTKFPCRLCKCSRIDIMKPNSDDCILRSSEDNLSFLGDAWDAFCKSIKHNLVTGKKIRLTDLEKEILSKCKMESIKPIKPAYLDLPSPFPGFSAYSYAQSDLMHTFANGFLEEWVANTIICLDYLSKKVPYQIQYRNNLGHLDTFISNFANKHSLPYPLRNFKNGVTIFCVGRSSNTKKDKGDRKSHLGMIDAQDIDCLILQMLLCKKTTYSIYIKKTCLSYS